MIIDDQLQLHGTYRRKDRIYTEDTYYGTGKKLSEATDAEKEADLKVGNSICTNSEGEQDKPRLTCRKGGMKIPSPTKGTRINWRCRRRR